MMNRKSFIKRLLAGAIITPVLPVIIAKVTEEKNSVITSDIGSGESKTGMIGCKWTPDGRTTISSLDGPFEGQVVHSKIYDDYRTPVEMTPHASKLWHEACERLFNKIKEK